MAMLMRGAPVAQALSEKIQQDCQTLRARGVVPTFGIVRVGEEADDLAYERGACRRAEQLGVAVERIALPADVTEEVLIQALERVNGDPRIHGCLLMRPLPPHLDTAAVGRVLRPEKDVDAVTVTSMGGMLAKAGVGFAPCTATACLELLHYYRIPLQGKKTVVVGKSMTVGLPTALLLMNEEATVSVCHILSDPEDTRRLCREAEIIISAAGHARLITRDYVRPGQVIVDVGVNAAPGGGLCGDVAFDEVEPVVQAITPVPGGVGAVTATVLVGHAVQAAVRQTAEQN